MLSAILKEMYFSIQWDNVGLVYFNVVFRIIVNVGHRNNKCLSAAAGIIMVWFVLISNTDFLEEIAKF